MSNNTNFINSPSLRLHFVHNDTQLYTRNLCSTNTQMLSQFICWSISIPIPKNETSAKKAIDHLECCTMWAGSW